MVPLCYFLLVSFAMNVNLKPVDSGSISIVSLGESEIKNPSRKLDSPLYSVSLKRSEQWSGFMAPWEDDDTDDLYVMNFLAIFISSNETLLSGSCPYFKDFKCTKPSCSQDDSAFYNRNYTRFSTQNASRVSLATQEISIANGAWKLNSSALYIHNCEFTDLVVNYGRAVSQIGLGLNGQAYQNFQASSPIFSFVFHSMQSGELIFGFNSTYVTNSSTGITLPCDLDWRMRVQSMIIGDAIISSNPVAMMFDLQTFSITLPESHYYSLKTYFTNILGVDCPENLKLNLFICIYVGDLQSFPTLTFVLQNNTLLSLPPETYMMNGFQNSYTTTFVLQKSTLSGVEYIILGREIMSQYYTVFQQLTNETAGITVYPHPINNSYLASFELDAQIIEHNLFTKISETKLSPSQEESDHEMPMSPPEDMLPPSQDEHKPEETVFPSYDENNKSDPTILYYFIGIIFIILISVLVAVRYLTKRKRVWFSRDKIEERQSPTVEMNESSYFVDTDKNSSNVDLENIGSE